MQVILYFPVLLLLSLCSAQPLLVGDSMKNADCVLQLIIHKVLPGDPYYRIFNGDEQQARKFANTRWRQLLSSYDYIAL